MSEATELFERAAKHYTIEELNELLQEGIYDESTRSSDRNRLRDSD